MKITFKNENNQTVTLEITKEAYRQIHYRAGQMNMSVEEFARGLYSHDLLMAYISSVKN